MGRGEEERGVGMADKEGCEVTLTLIVPTHHATSMLTPCVIPPQLPANGLHTSYSRTHLVTKAAGQLASMHSSQGFLLLLPIVSSRPRATADDQQPTKHSTDLRVSIDGTGSED
jgi:hypothetical protein